MNVRTIIEGSEAAVHALETLQKMTRVGGDTAATALAAIDAGLQVLIDATKAGTGGVKDDPLASIDLLHATLAADDAKAKAEQDAKFGQVDSTNELGYSSKFGPK